VNGLVGVGVGVRYADAMGINDAARETTPNIRIKKRDRISFIMNLPVNSETFPQPPRRNIPEFDVPINL
jgi:hypothetical protein